MIPRISAGPARCAGGGEESDHPAGLALSRPSAPLLGTKTVSGCCRGHPRHPPPPPRLAAVPQLLGPAPKTAGREAGGGERAAAAGLRGWDPRGQRHERAQAGKGGGRRKPPRQSPPRGLRTSGPQKPPPPVGGVGETSSRHPAFLGKGRRERLSGGREGTAWGVKRCLSVHTSAGWGSFPPPHRRPSPHAFSSGRSSSFWASSAPEPFGRCVTAASTKPGTAGWLGTAGWG